MLALHRRSRQVVVADEKLNGPDMVGSFLQKDNASQTSRETRCFSVLLHEIV